MMRSKFRTSVAVLVSSLIAAALAITLNWPIPTIRATTYSDDGAGSALQPASYPVRVMLPRSIPKRADSAPGPASPHGEVAKMADGPFAPIQPSPSSVERAKAPSPSPSPGLVKVDFDIATFGRNASSGANSLIDSKQLVVNGTRVGTIELTLGEGSILSVDRRRLAELVRKRVPRLGETLDRFEGEHVTIDALRTRDVRIGYDPLTDALTIETAS